MKKGSVTLLQRFLDRKCRVLTHVGWVDGILKGWTKSFHNGFGGLILKQGQKLLYIRNWLLIIAI